MNDPIIVVGASSLAINVLDISLALGRSIAAFVDSSRRVDTGEAWAGVPVLGSVDEARALRSAKHVVVAIGDNFRRQQVSESVRLLHPDLEFTTLIHPDATVSMRATVGAGSILLPGSRVGAYATIGMGPYLNFNTVVAHDCQIGDHVSMSPGAVLAGNVTIGDRTMIALNASVRERVVIGSDSLIGANSFVNCDIVSGSVVTGVPGKVVRSRQVGDKYLR